MRFLESLGDTKLMNKCVKIAKAKEESVAHSIYRLTHPSPPCLTSGISGDLLKWKELQTKAKASTDEGYTFRLLLVIKVKEPQMFVTISDVHLKTRKAVIKEVRDQISQGATHLIHSNLLP